MFELWPDRLGAMLTSSIRESYEHEQDKFLTRIYAYDDFH